MKKLLKVHISVWIIIFITISISIISLIFILNYRVEEVYKTNMKFNSGATFLEIPSRDSYKFTTGNKITIKFNNQYYIGKIGQISSSTKDLMKVPITWTTSSIPVIPNGSFSVQIIHNNQKVLYSIFSPSV